MTEPTDADRATVRRCLKSATWRTAEQANADKQRMAQALADARAQGYVAGIEAAERIAAREYDAAEAIRRELTGNQS